MAGKNFSMLILPILLAGIIGCSRENPPLIPQSLDSASLSRATNSQHLLWGIFDISIDSASWEAKVIPLRTGSFNCNVVKFLQPPSSPINLLMVSVNTGSDFSTGYLDLDITIRHPFPGLAKYRGFDVRGIVMGGGSKTFNFDPSVLRAGESDLRLLNPDGWTRWWNPSEFTSYNTILGYTKGNLAPSAYTATATINAYKYFADGLDKNSSLSELNISGRGSFSVSPGANTRRYILQFPNIPGGGKYHFNYAVDASWALPDPAYAPDYPLEAFPIEANTQEAWLASINSNKSTAWFVNDSAKGGKVVLEIEVYDWQGIENQNGISDEVTSILVDSPVFPGPIDIFPAASVSAGGPGSSVWTVEITDLNLTASGTFECWIAIEADSPDNYAPQIDGDPYFFDWPDVPLRSYWAGSISVSPDYPYGPPMVKEVIPPKGIVSSEIGGAKIIGSGFQPGASLEFKHDSGATLVLTGISVIDETLIQCDVECDGPLGFYDVTVTNPDTQFGTLEDGFELIKEPTDSVWWKSHMYNAQNIGRNPTVPGADPEKLKLLWQAPVGGDKKYPTPVIADNKIFFTGNIGFYANTSMTVYCFDLLTGKMLWSQPINPSNEQSYRAFAGPVWWEGPDGIDRLAVGGDQVYCFDADSGVKLWSFDGVGGENINWISNQLQEYDGMVLARSRLTPLYVLDFITGSVISKVNGVQGTEGGCAAKDGKVYFASNYYLECADILSGTKLWSLKLPYDAQITHWINPTIVNDRCYVSTYQGYIFCVATGDDPNYKAGEIIWEWSDTSIPPGMNPLVGGTAATIINGKTRLFAAAAFSNNYVYCIEDLGNKGKTLWRSSITGYFDSSPVWSSAPSYPEGVVYCPDRNGYIDAFDASNGYCIWNEYVETELRSGVAAVFDYLVVTSGTDVTVYKPE